MPKPFDESPLPPGPPLASTVVPVEQMEGDDDEDTALLKEMSKRAKDYILSFRWCDSIESGYFGGGVGKILAIFLFKINSTNPEVDPWEWVVVGDIPPAYLPLEDAGTSLEVFDLYVGGMKRWVQFAREGVSPLPEDCVPPIEVPATPEWAKELNGRLDSLNELVRCHFE